MWNNILGYEPKYHHLIWLQLNFKQPQSGAVLKEQHCLDPQLKAFQDTTTRTP